MIGDGLNIEYYIDSFIFFNKMLKATYTKVKSVMRNFIVNSYRSMDKLSQVRKNSYNGLRLSIDESTKLLNLIILI